MDFLKLRVYCISFHLCKVLSLLEGCLDLILSPLPSVKIQIVDGKYQLIEKYWIVTGNLFVISYLYFSFILYFQYPSSIQRDNFGQKSEFGRWGFVQKDVDNHVFKIECITCLCYGLDFKLQICSAFFQD